MVVDYYSSLTLILASELSTCTYNQLPNVGFDLWDTFYWIF